MSEAIKNRYDFVILFDVENGNPNGDPDAGNMPRIDPETGYGLVTDVCLKRKIRNYVETVREGEPGYRIYVKDGVPLNRSDAEACAYVDVNPDKLKEAKKKDEKLDEKLRNFMCSNFFDIRTFGAVMSTGPNAGQVRGPVQLTFGRSVDPIVFLEHGLTVCAARDDDKPFDAQVGIQGRKNTVPYGLYVAYGFISPALAKQTGFSEEDLELFWSALRQMFEHDRSAARGLMTTQKLIIFKHDSALGNASASELFAKVKIEKKPGVACPRSFMDYTIEIDKAGIPNGVTVIE